MRQIFSLSVLHLGVCCMYLLLATSSVHAQKISGRVVDAAGRPIERAAIRVWRKVSDVIGRSENKPLRIDGVAQWKTDGDGRFETPEIGGDAPVVRVVAQAEGMLAGRSGWLSAAGTTRIDSGEIVLLRLRSVEGRVVDRNGRPVAGVNVFNSGDAHQRVETTTDQTGKFTLHAVPEGTVFVFAEKPGYRFTGMVHGDTGDIQMQLARADESLAALAMRKPPLSDAEGVALAHKMLDPYLNAVTGSRRRVERDQAFSALARVDAMAAWGYLDKLLMTEKLDEKQYRELIVSEWMAHEPAPDWDKLRNLLESSGDSDWAADCFLRGATQFISESDRRRGGEWIGLALARAHASNNASRRLCLLAMAAEAHWRFADHKQARALAREAKVMLDNRQPGSPLYEEACERVARALAPFDLIAALAYLDRLTQDSQFTLAGSGLAILLASINPVKAEEVWNYVSRRQSHDRTFLHSRDLRAPEFCYRLARSDLRRAERIAGALQSPFRRFQALLSVAELAEGEAARRLLAQATDIPCSPGIALKDDLFQIAKPAAETLAVALAVAERVDPIMGRELLWRAISLRAPRPTPDSLDDEPLIADLALARLIARFEPEIARILLNPMERRLEAPCSEVVPFHGAISEFFNTAPFVDPLWAIESFERMPDSPILPQNGSKHIALLSLVGSLGLSEEAYRHYGFSTWRLYIIGGLP